MIRCLVIEDNSFDRKVLRKAAEGCCLDFELHEVTSLRAAEEMLRDQAFDAIFLDFRLPDGDGLSFSKRFLAEGHPSTPVIMLTAEGSEQLAREALQAGILDYLPKQDLGPETLERAVSNALAKARLQRERQAALDELQRSNDALRRFAGVVAHDLKAPIRQIRTLTVFLGEDHEDALNDEGRKLLCRIDRAANRAYMLIDGMLAYASLDKANEVRDELSLRSAVDAAVDNLIDLITDTGAVIEIGDLPTIVGVEAQLMQLFQNLISNALKFRHSDRAPLVRITAEPAQHGPWLIQVEDNGIGIAADDRQRIFGMLERLHRQDLYEGSGIGLATCRRIAENHGGEIWCQSEEGVGSRFLVTLDAKEPSGPA